MVLSTIHISWKKQTLFSWDRQRTEPLEERAKVTSTAATSVSSQASPALQREMLSPGAATSARISKSSAVKP